MQLEGTPAAGGEGEYSDDLEGESAACRSASKSRALVIRWVDISKPTTVTHAIKVSHPVDCPWSSLHCWTAFSYSVAVDA